MTIPLFFGWIPPPPLWNIYLLNHHYLEYPFRLFLEDGFVWPCHRIRFHMVWIGIWFSSLSTILFFQVPNVPPKNNLYLVNILWNIFHSSFVKYLISDATLRRADFSYWVYNMRHMHRVAPITFLLSHSSSLQNILTLIQSDDSLWLIL